MISSTTRRAESDPATRGGRRRASRRAHCARAAHAAGAPPVRPRATEHRAARDRGGQLGDAGGELRPDAPRDAPRRGRQDESGPLLVASVRLEEPDAHAESRRDLRHALLRPVRGRADGDRDPAGRRRRVDHRDDHGLLAGAAGGCRTGGEGRRQGWQVRRAPSRSLGGGAGRVHSRCPAGTTRATPCCAPSRRAAARRTSRGRSPTRSASRFYPLSQASAPPPTTFVDAIDVVFDSTIPYDIRFFQSLDRIVQHEPWLDRDKAMIDVLRTLGIEKGKEFRPDVDTTDAARRRGARGPRLARCALRGVACAIL